MLFQIDLSGGSPEEVGEHFWASVEDSDDGVRGFADDLVRGVTDRRQELDRWIIGSAENWRMERMAVVDRNVLRMAVYEMLENLAPPVVVIDEAIDVAKKFGSGESGSFINGVLDSIRTRLEQRRSAPAAPGEGGDA